MPLRAVLFDLWGTLIVDSPQRNEPRRATRLRLLREALTGAGQAIAEEALSTAFPAFLEALDAHQRAGRDISMPEKVDLFLAVLGLAGRVAPDGARAVEDALGGAIGASPPLPASGALELLDEASRRGLELGLVSNTGITPGYVLRGLLAEQGLRPYLRVLTFSDEARLAKPAPQVFACTLEALGVAPADAAFVGDVPELDVAGPRALGMWTVQIGDARADGIEPHARIDALAELLPELQRLGLLE
jgi:putative hydrolase of the HAD superfamily